MGMNFYQAFQLQQFVCEECAQSAARALHDREHNTIRNPRDKLKYPTIVRWKADAGRQLPSDLAVEAVLTYAPEAFDREAH
jgi:hypothetical protein